MKVWITKYALTGGIKEIDAEYNPDYPAMVTLKGDRSKGFCDQHFHGEGRDWHRTLESAVTKAEEMRNKALVSLARKQRKLQQMRFP